MSSLIITFDETKAYQLRVHMTQGHSNAKAKIITTLTKEKQVSVFQRLSTGNNARMVPQMAKPFEAEAYLIGLKPKARYDSQPWFLKYKENPFGIHLRKIQAKSKMRNTLRG